MGDWPMAISQSQKREGPLVLDGIASCPDMIQPKRPDPLRKRARFSD